MEEVGLILFLNAILIMIHFSSGSLCWVGAIESTNSPLFKYVRDKEHMEDVSNG